MSFARARKRKQEKAMAIGQQRGIQQAARVRQSVKGAYVYQMRMEQAWRKMALHNLSACFLYSMHEHYGFGKGRLMKLRDKMQSEFDALVAKNVSVEEVAVFLRDDIGVDIDIAATDPRANRERQIEFKAVQEMSAAFFMALLDEFGWKKKRLSDAYMHVAELSKQVSYGQMKYEDICAKVNEVMTR